MSKFNEDIIYEVLSVVEEIPVGKVATYGQIARLTGHDKNARLVGKILSRAEFYGEYPCHRVVNHSGRTVLNWTEQRTLLEAEGIEFNKNGNVNMSKYQWNE
ncbi:MAG: MGMT family protein [Firmicutes bacterium]|nr:MGMT family protein [Bacillota bacterium]